MYHACGSTCIYIVATFEITYNIAPALSVKVEWKANSISCSQCKLWVHKKCSVIKGRLNVNPDYVCPRCLDQAHPIDGRPVTQVDVDGTLLDVEASFCYLGDMLCAGGGCALAIATRIEIVSSNWIQAAIWPQPQC